MKPKILLYSYFLAFAAAILSAACANAPQTVVLHLEKQAPLVRSLVSAPRFLEDGGRFAYLDPEPSGLPEGWKAYFVTEDFPQALYQGFCAGKVDTATCMRYFNAWQRDTASCSATPARVFLAVAFGRDASGAERVMFDTDGDYDFAGERSYLFSRRPSMVKMAYERVVGKKPVPDVTWVEVSDQFDSRCLVMREMTQGTFDLGGTAYTCTIVSHSASYHKQGCKVVLINDEMRLEHELKEYTRLGDTWYRIDSIAPDGRFLRLEHVPDAENRESVQVGFRPYAFTATDVAGKTIRFPDDFAGKYVLLDFWALSCAPCRDEICNLYPDIYARFGECGFEIVGVADNTAADLRGFMAKHAMPWTVIADRENGDVHRKLYGVNGYPTLVLLGPDGRVLETGDNLRGWSLEPLLRRYMPDAPQKTVGKP